MKDVPEFPSLWGWLTNWNRGKHHGATGETDDSSPMPPRVTVSSYEPTTFSGVMHKFLQEDDYGKTQSKPKCVLVLLLLGFVGVAAGVILIFINPYDLIFRWKATFAEGGEMFEMWRQPPVDLYLRVWLWNVTNRDEFLAGKEKLKVAEVGPFVYRENFTHDNVIFNSNGTMTFNPKHPLIWVPEMSEGHTEDEILTLPNIALLSFAHVMSSASFLTRLGVNVIITQTNSQPLVRMTAKEFMFGYQSALVTLGNKFMPSWIMFEKLGLIDRMYDFDGDVEVDFTGEGDQRLTGLMDRYNGRPNLPHWEGDCGNLRLASDGTKFMSFIQPNSTHYFFRKSLCRPMPLVQVGEREKSGMLGYEYIFREDALDNGVGNPENKCYCRQGQCLPEGLIDVQDCYYGFPIVVSYPHFFRADKRFREEIDGFEPDAKKHQTNMLIEPVSGMPLEIAVKTQINLALRDVSQMAHVGRRFSNMVIPLVWTEIGMRDLTDSMAWKFQMYINVLPVVADAIKYTLIVSGTALIAACLFSVFGRPCKRDPEARRGSRAWLQDQDMNADRKTLPELLVAERERSKKFTFTGLAKDRDRELQVYSSLLSPGDVPDHMSSNASSRRTSFEQAYC